MVNVLIVHGAYGKPSENWFPWLKERLEVLGCKVFVPQFPTPKNQNLKRWDGVFDEFKEYVNKDTILIGHSIGVSYVLTLIERFGPVSGAFLVGGFVGSLKIGKFKVINKTIAGYDFDFDIIKKNCRIFFVYNSDNDPYVELSKGKELAGLLGCKLTLVKGGGHMNSESGYDKFELLLRDVELTI